MVLAMLMISSRGMDFVCLMFFSFFLSLGGSLRALMTREEAEGTTETAACRFWMVSLTVTRRPFCLDVSLCPQIQGLLNRSYPVTGSFGDIFSDLLRG